MTIGLAMLLLALLGGTFFFRSNEPAYQGFTLTECLEDYYTNAIYLENSVVRDRDATNAFYHMGAAVAPYVLRWIDYERPHWSQRLSSYLWSLAKWPLIQNAAWSYDRPVRFAEIAPELCRALDPAAADAVLPGLIQRMNSPKQVVALKAKRALACLGPKGLPPLMEALRDTARTNRGDFALAIGNMGDSGKPAAPLLARLLAENTNKRDFDLALVMALQDLQADPGLVLPPLIQIIADPARRNPWAINYVAMFGPAASNAIPALNLAFQDPVPGTRQAALKALRSICPEMSLPDDQDIQALRTLPPINLPDP
jgi:hypothetical protein